MKLTFHGPSWGFGAICAAVYFGHVSPWLLLTAPLFLIQTDWLTWRLKWKTPEGKAG